MISFNRNRIKGKKGSPIRQLEDFPSNTRFTSAFANLVLAVSAGWALRRLSSFAVTSSVSEVNLATLSKVPFYLVLLHAVVCFITFGNPKYGERLRWLHIWTAELCVIIGLPCFVFQLILQHNVPLQSLLPFAGGAVLAGIVYQIIRKDLQTVNRYLINIVVLVCLTSITAISYIHSIYYGLSAVFAYSINYFIIGTTGTAFNLPAIDLFSYGYVFFNYFAVRAILD